MPLLTAQHKRRRLEWAQARAHWIEEDWRRVVFSDEVSLHLVQRNQRQYIRHHRGARAAVYQPRLQADGGAIMVWGAISADGALPLA